MRCARCQTICSDDDFHCAACRTRLDSALIDPPGPDPARRAASLGLALLAVGIGAGPVLGSSVPLIPTEGTGWAANLILWGAIGGGIGAVCGYVLGFVLGWVLPRLPAAGGAGR